MPGPLALPLGLAAGSSLAWLAASIPSTAAGGSELRARAAATYFGVLVLGPAVGLLELASMPWANLYVASLPSAVGLMLAIAAGAAPVCGERLARARLDRGDTRTPLGLALGGALATLLGGAIARGRIEVVTSQVAFERGLGGDALFDHRAGAALALSMVAILAGYALSVRALSATPAGSPGRASATEKAPGGRERRRGVRPTPWS